LIDDYLVPPLTYSGTGSSGVPEQNTILDWLQENLFQRFWTGIFEDVPSKWQEERLNEYYEKEKEAMDKSKSKAPSKSAPRGPSVRKPSYSTKARP
jgi:hypothetical protein